MEKEKWVLCPICNNKTRIKVRPDTVLENFPLFCPKCKQETIISVTGQNVVAVKKAAQVSRVKDEVAFVVLNGNYALQAGFSVAHDAVAYETSASAAAKTYANVLVVKAGNENNEGIQALVKVLKSDEIKQFINDAYDGAVIPFED